MNPWISVWLHPRKTVQYVMEHKTEKFVFFIAMISGIILSLDMAVNDDLLATWNTLNYIVFIDCRTDYWCTQASILYAAINHLFSKMLGGQGTSDKQEWHLPYRK